MDGPERNPDAPLPRRERPGSAALAGVRVLDLSRLLPGGFCSLLLSDLGAEVVKIEDMDVGDYVRWAPPFYEEADESSQSAIFVALNRGKRSLRLDLKEPRGREVMLRLVRDADVLLESFRPGVMERLGLGYERLREENPGLIHCAITGYGQDGPNRDRPGHDLNYLALVGLLALGGEADGPPAQSAAPIADIGGGALMATIGILAALRERERSGEGQSVDVSMADGALSWLAMAAAAYFCDGTPQRRGDLVLAGKVVCYRPYRCSDGWVTLAAVESKFWREFCLGVGREDLVEQQFEPVGSAAHEQLEALFLTRTRAEWQRFASERDCCVEPVLELEEALDSELVRARGMVVDVRQPGVGHVRTLGFPFKLSRTPARAEGPAPALGEHTHDILGRAGFTAAEIGELERAGVIGAVPAERRATFLA